MARNKHDLSYLLNATCTPVSPLQADSAIGQRILNNTCALCGHCFAQSTDLRKHIRTVHEGHRPHRCDECGKRFGEKGNLRKHQRAVHRNERPFACATCDAAFAFKDGLSRHVKTVHSKLRPKA